MQILHRHSNGSGINKKAPLWINRSGAVRGGERKILQAFEYCCDTLATANTHANQAIATTGTL